MREEQGKLPVTQVRKPCAKRLIYSIIQMHNTPTPVKIDSQSIFMQKAAQVVDRICVEEGGGWSNTVGFEKTYSMVKTYSIGRV